MANQANKISMSSAEHVAREAIIAAVHAVISDAAVTMADISYPPNEALGDFTISCFGIAQRTKKNPAEIAKQLATEIKPTGIIARVTATGPYINIMVDRTLFTQQTITEIFKNKDEYGEAKIGKGKRVMIEYFSPNTNKQLTVGHIRNFCLGWSLARVMKAVGYKVVEVTLYNDRGIAIAKAMVAYQKWGEEKTPTDANMKPDHFVGDFYVQFGQAAKDNKHLEQEAQFALQAWEKGDAVMRGTWQKLMTWVQQGYEATLRQLDSTGFDEQYYESEYYQHGKEMIDLGLKKGVFKQHPEGYVYVELEKFGMPDKVLLRSNGTSLYITQDIYLASLKNRHHLNESIYVVGSEQDLQFKQLFKILELLKFEHIKKNVHLSYGMARLPSGKIKSREGLAKGAGADDLIAELTDLAKQEISKRFTDTPAEELDRRAHAIALGALKFYMLSFKPQSDMVFDPQKSIAFVGRTGPYVQYTYARVSSIISKSPHKITLRGVDFKVLTNEYERTVINTLSRYPGIVVATALQHDPSLIAEYVYQLSKDFSALYEQISILKAEPALLKSRLALCCAVQQVLGNGLRLLGIKPLERM